MSQLLSLFVNSLFRIQQTRSTSCGSKQEQGSEKRKNFTSLVKMRMFGSLSGEISVHSDEIKSFTGFSIVNDLEKAIG